MEHLHRLSVLLFGGSNIIFVSGYLVELINGSTYSLNRRERSYRCREGRLTNNGVNLISPTKRGIFARLNFYRGYVRFIDLSLSVSYDNSKNLEVYSIGPYFNGVRLDYGCSVDLLQNYSRNGRFNPLFSRFDFNFFGRWLRLSNSIIRLDGVNCETDYVLRVGFFLIVANLTLWG